MLKYLITLRYVKLLAYVSAKYLQETRNESHKHRYTYYYGFQIIYGAINKAILLITLSLIFGILPQLLIAVFSFCILRVWAGGLHFNSYTKCSYVSFLSFLVIGLLAKYVQLGLLISVFIFIAVFIAFLLYAPVEHPNRPINKNEKIKFKTISLILAVLLLVIVIIFNSSVIINPIIYGVALAGIITTPIVSKLN